MAPCLLASAMCASCCGAAACMAPRAASVSGPVLLLQGAAVPHLLEHRTSNSACSPRWLLGSHPQTPPSAAAHQADAELAAQVQGAPKAINHSGTRFPKDLQRSASATPSSSSAGGSVTAGGGRGAAGVAAGGAGPAGRGAAALAAAAGGTRGYDILATVGGGLWWLWQLL